MSIVLQSVDAWIARQVCRACRDACARPQASRASTAVTSVERCGVALRCGLRPAAACRAAAASGELGVLRWAMTAARLDECAPAECVVAAARAGRLDVVRWMHSRLKVPTWRERRPPISAQRVVGLTARVGSMGFGVIPPFLMAELMADHGSAPVSGCLTRASLAVVGAAVAVVGGQRVLWAPDATRIRPTLWGLVTGCASACILIGAFPCAPLEDASKQRVSPLQMASVASCTFGVLALTCAYAMLAAARHPLPRGDLSAAEIEQSEGRGLDSQVCRAAAHGGHVEVLEWARSAGFVLDANLLVVAADAGHCEILEWLFDVYRGAGDDIRDNCADVAARAGHVGVLEWMRVRGRHDFDDTSCILAAENGHIGVLDWAHRYWPWGIDWQQVGTAAAAAGRREVDRWGQLRGIWVA